MPHYEFFWTPHNEEHLAQHGVTPDEFEEVVLSTPIADEETSGSTGLPGCRGYTLGGRFLFCVYEMLDDELTIYPVTAYEIEDE